MANINGNGNYAKNQNIYNTDTGKKMTADYAGQEVKDYRSLKLETTMAKTVNGSVPEYNNGLFRLRYNKSYGYWVSESGQLYYEDEGKLVLLPVSAYEIFDPSMANGYQRKQAKYYYQVPSRNPDYKGKKVLVHHIVSWCWIEKGPYNKWSPSVVVNHIDGNGQNNHPSNLEYVTFQENIAYYQATGR